MPLMGCDGGACEDGAFATRWHTSKKKMYFYLGDPKRLSVCTAHAAPWLSCQAAAPSPAITPRIQGDVAQLPSRMPPEPEASGSSPRQERAVPGARVSETP